MKSATAQLFRYSAVEASGENASGTLLASTAEDARAQLVSRGLLPLRVRQAHPLARARHSLSADDSAVGLRVLAELLASGLPVPRALKAFEAVAPRAWRAGLPAIQAAVREGATLSNALARSPLPFPPLVLSIVRAGEAGDGLATALQRAAAHAERAAELRASVRGALAYPATVAVAGTISITVMLSVVLPRFALLLADLGQELPASTRLLLSFAGLGRFVVPVLLLGCAAVVGLWIAAENDEALARRRSRIVLRVPGVGTVWRAVIDARVGHALAALFGGGVAVRSALRHAADNAGDREFAERLRQASEDVRHGDSLTSALRRHDAVTETTSRLLRAGEETGRVAEMCTHAARLAEQRADRAIRTAVRLLEPATILAFAGVVGFVAIALLQAVYAVRPS